MNTVKGTYEIHSANCLEFMASLPEGSVDCVITDPPYLGFGFNNENYIEVFRPFVIQMMRCAGVDPRVAISQPRHRLGHLAEMIGSGVVMRIQDAFEDGRGEDAFFLIRGNASDREPEVESWKQLPPTAHPNSREVNKMASLIKIMSEPGDTILDPFCGSGSIGVAAVLLGRHYIGVELEQSRAADARQRFLTLGVQPLVRG